MFDIIYQNMHKTYNKKKDITKNIDNNKKKLLLY